MMIASCVVDFKESGFLNLLQKHMLEQRAPVWSVVGVPGYGSRDPYSIPGATRFSEE
jgi:hypothetical protein